MSNYQYFKSKENQLRIDKSSKVTHASGAKVICEAEECENKQCTGTCANVVEVNLDHHVSHNPHLGGVADFDSNGAPRKQFVVLTKEPIKLDREALQNVTEEQLQPVPKFTKYMRKQNISSKLKERKDKIKTEKTKDEVDKIKTDKFD